ncbi:MAG TPA: sigma-70 family RNA polymerase sigma factor [Steroidobacteraceae bacterium]|jgi:RNA polymerase sigma-70 factor (ECF subfamily)|nr:sigma-70 family RNA polymerase sigma factor [Steroidobacteraceae bacterium]
MQNTSAPASSADVLDVATGPGISDLSLVRCAQSGESRAFDRLMLKYRARVVELAMRYTRNSADAEDATQETFLKAYRGLRDFRCESAFYTWLYRIASNCARNLLKARRRDLLKNAIDFSDYHKAARHPTRLRELATPEELALTADIRGAVNNVLDGLSEEHRTAITLREIDGLSYRQIASAMSIPIGTVRSRVFRARDLIDHKLRRVHDGGLGRHTAQRQPYTGSATVA